MKTSIIWGTLLLVGGAFAGPMLADDEPAAAVPVAVAVETPARPSPAVAKPAAPKASGATARVSPVAAKTVPVTPATVVKPLVATVQLSGGGTLSGTFIEPTELRMKTSFGEASFPFSEIAGIKMAQEGNATTTVVLYNGDSVTGAMDMNRFDLQTDWGKAEINAPNVSSVLFTQGLKWISVTGLNGTRWILTPDPPIAQAAATPPPAPAPTNRATSPVPGNRTVFFPR